MGNVASTVTDEHVATWQEPAVKEWQAKAEKILNSYYLAFGKKPDHGYDRTEELQLLRTKICYALFGDPKIAVDLIEDAYTDEQKAEAQKTCDVILEVVDKEKCEKLAVRIIFICCKQAEKEFCLPIFGVNIDEEKCRYRYVDNQNRIYDDWADWKKNNTLPMMKYCYPKDGYFSCASGAWKFDENETVLVEYGNSPACDVSSRTARLTDVVATVGTLGAGVIGIAALLTPAGFIAGPIIAGSSFAGGGSALWGLGRAVHRLVDKGGHGESLADFESWTLWISIGATPLTFLSALSNARLATGASQGRIFSNSTRMFATVLNFTTVGAGGVMVAFGIANLIEKHNKDQLDTLDVLQFSMSVFFFTHTLIQPITANSIIKNAQGQHIDSISSRMTDAEAKASFEKFLKENRGDMTADSKVIRSLNRMDNPEFFFKANSDATSMKIGGRKGKTVVVTDSHGRTNRINPNRIINTTKSQGPVVLKNSVKIKIQDSLKVKDIKDFELNGTKIFENLSDPETGRLKNVFGGAAGYDMDIVATAKTISERMKIKNANDFMSVVEIIAADSAGKDGQALTKHLSNITNNYSKFIDGIQADLSKATNIAERSNLSFSDPFKAVYHFRKHGSDFPSKIMGNDICFYLEHVPAKFVKDAHLIEQCKFSDGTIQKIYAKPNNDFAVVIETPNNQTISTLFKKQGTWANYVKQIQKLHDKAIPIPGINDAAARLAATLGFPEMNVYICLNKFSNPIPLSDIQDLDEEDHNNIANILAAFADDNVNND